MASHRVAQARDRNCHQQYQAVLDTLGLEISVGVYDGDTKSEEKSRIRDECNRDSAPIQHSTQDWFLVAFGNTDSH